MNVKIPLSTVGISSALKLPLLLGSLGFLTLPLIAQESQEGEILTRGPVHEAFANAINYDPQPGPLVPKVPPAPVEELPPDQKPEGDNVIWISGYWAWDDDRKDFIWISGIWRDVPPGRTWVGGYWEESNEGHRWVSGYWGDVAKPKAAYLPLTPPESLETGPNSPLPSEDHIWVPGYWAWYGNRYAWSPGYWQVVRPSHVWVPSTYVWTPHGYLYVGGYWDYVVARRGLVFAPVYFAPTVVYHTGWYYRPRTIISISVFDDCLFYRPRYGHYYFGDYYGSTYVSAGFQISFNFHTRGRGYDPHYAHRRWEHRRDTQWTHRQRETYQARTNDASARPPRTFAAQQEAASLRNGIQAPSSNRIAVPLAEAGTAANEGASRTNPSPRLRTVGANERETIDRQRRDTQALATERRQTETRSDASRTERTPRPERNAVTDGTTPTERTERTPRPERNAVADGTTPIERTERTPRSERNAVTDGTTPTERTERTPRPERNAVTDGTTPAEKLDRAQRTERGDSRDLPEIPAASANQTPARRETPPTQRPRTEQSPDGDGPNGNGSNRTWQPNRAQDTPWRRDNQTPSTPPAAQSIRTTPSSNLMVNPNRNITPAERTSPPISQNRPITLQQPNRPQSQQRIQPQPQNQIQTPTPSMNRPQNQSVQRQITPPVTQSIQPRPPQPRIQAPPTPSPAPRIQTPPTMSRPQRDPSVQRTSQPENRVRRNAEDALNP
jgi:hypothetical protein